MSNPLQPILREHPTLLLTFCYLLITLLGVLYSYFFYQEFGINIIKFADLSDFLLASILEPRSVGIFIGLVVLLVLFDKIETKFKNRFKRDDVIVNWHFNSKYFELIGLFIGFSTGVIFLILSLAQSNANDIKSDEPDQYKVRLSDPDLQTGSQTLALLGSTTRFGYFYDAKTKESLVVPLENISFMRKVVPVIKEAGESEDDKLQNNELKDKAQEKPQEKSQN
jgi:hypothetical protein